MADSLQVLRDISSRNVREGRTISNPDGSVSSIRSGSVRDERLNKGRPTLIPFVGNKRIMSQDEAIQNAIDSGLKFPSFDTDEAATAASIKLSKSLGMAGELKRLGINPVPHPSIQGTGFTRSEFEAFRVMADPMELVNKTMETETYQLFNDNEKRLSLQLIIDQFQADAEAQVFDTKNEGFRSFRERARKIPRETIGEN